MAGNPYDVLSQICAVRSAFLVQLFQLLSTYKSHRYDALSAAAAADGQVAYTAG